MGTRIPKRKESYSSEMSYANHARSFKYGVAILIQRTQNSGISLAQSLSREIIVRHFFNATSGSSENQSRIYYIIQRLVYNRLFYPKRGTEEGIRSERSL